MASQTVSAQAAAAFDFEVLDDDSDQVSPWIEPEKLKLTQRLGRGTFGDVWLAIHHRSTEDYEVCHEVAVKMLPLVKEDHLNVLLTKLDGLFLKCHGLEGICPLYGLSIISGKLCMVMKFCEGSIGDKVSRLKEGKLAVPDVLRYGIELAQGILELHSKGILVLNLKPSNVLLDENNNAILGDFGVPCLLLSSPRASSDVSLQFGTPNYMAPEQWQPEIRGPLSFETDSWGFGCTVVEMLTGVRPWRGKSVDEIYNSVVRKHEKPQIPFGLPSSLENILLGCFEYDLRNRPLISDILKVFQSSQNSVFSDGGLVSLRSGKTKAAARSNIGYTEWFLLKDHLQVGDTVRSRKPRNSCRAKNMDVPEGTVVGLEHDTDRDRFVLVRVHGIHDPMRIHASTLERVIFGLAAGDWLRSKEEQQKKDNKRRSPVGVLHSIGRDGVASVGFIGMETLWEGPSSEFEMAEPYCPGQFVRLKSKVLGPRFGWPRMGGGNWATGRVLWVLPNGCLVVKFPGMLSFEDNKDEFLADPAEVELVSFETCSGMVNKYQHLKNFHWAVRPLLIALGLATVMRTGIFVGGKMGRRSRGSEEELESCGKTGGISVWHSNVAKLF